jgi:membrane fusion protein, multidrug efflux system
VPPSAVFKNADGTDYVLIAGADNKAHTTTVETGLKSATEVQIVSGIKEGDAVITSSGYGLPDKTQIKIEAPGTPEKDAGAADESATKAGDKAKPAEKAKD